MIIYDTSVVRFSDVTNTDAGFIYEITYENFSKASCIKKGEYMINVDNGEKYYILKRNKQGRLKESERYKINLNVPYVYSYRDPEKIQPLKYLKALKIKLEEMRKINKQKTLKR